MAKKASNRKAMLASREKILTPIQYVAGHICRENSITPEQFDAAEKAVRTHIEKYDDWEYDDVCNELFKYHNEGRNWSNERKRPKYTKITPGEFMIYLKGKGRKIITTSQARYKAHHWSKKENDAWDRIYREDDRISQSLKGKRAVKGKKEISPAEYVELKNQGKTPSVARVNYINACWSKEDWDELSRLVY